MGGWFVALTIAALPLPAKTETITLRSGDETVSAYLAVPDSGGPHPALVVIHEWWGLNDWVKEQAQKFAEQGYMTLAVDLYRGKVAYDPNLAHELSRGLPQDQAIRDLKAAFNYLASRPDVRKERSARWAGAWGAAFLFCWPSMNRSSPPAS